MDNEEYLKLAFYLESKGLVKIRRKRCNPTKYTGVGVTTEVVLTKKGERHLYNNFIPDIERLFKITKKEIDGLFNKLK